MSVKDTDLAWLAGIIDGEGSVSMSLGKNGYYNPMVHVVNTDMAIIDAVADIYNRMGARFHFHVRKINHLGKRPVACLQISSGPELEKFLPQIIPYLRSVKARKASAMLEFVKSRNPKRNAGKNDSRAYTPAERGFAEAARSIN